MTNEDQNENSTSNVEMAVALTAAWLSNASTRADFDEVSAFLTGIESSIAALRAGGSVTAADEEEHVPAVSVRKSLASDDHIISMIDGKPYRTLKRHLSTNGLTPDQYRERYNLKPDYPMVAPTYSQSRSALAKQIGLGRKSKD